MRREQGSGMQIQVLKTDLVTRLTENKAKHSAEYKEAYSAYKIQLIHMLTAGIESLKADKTPDLNVYSVTKPKSYESEYDLALNMLKWSNDDLIELDRVNFQAYIEDIWDWSESFKNISESYKSRR